MNELENQYANPTKLNTRTNSLNKTNLAYTIWKSTKMLDLKYPHYYSHSHNSLKFSLSPFQINPGNSGLPLQLSSTISKQPQGLNTRGSPKEVVYKGKEFH